MLCNDMKLGVFLGIGESFNDFKIKGQYELIVNYHLKNYSKHFDEVFVFSYADEKMSIFGNVHILPNRFTLHRYIYSFILPILYRNLIKQCNVIRALQLTGGIPAFVARIILKIPYVFNYGFDYPRIAQIEGKPFRAYLLRCIASPIMKYASAILVTSRRFTARFPNFALSKTKHIPNGVDTQLFKLLKVKKNKTILFVGRLEKQKNLENLIMACANLKKLKYQLLFIGDGSLKQKLVSLAHRLDVSLKIISSVSHTKLPRLISKAEIFILPSLIEGQPKALLEAMSCQMPVIASDISAHREIIISGNNGILCTATPQGIQQAFTKLVSNQKLAKQLGREARKTIVSGYSMSQLNKREVALLHKCGRVNEK